MPKFVYRLMPVEPLVNSDKCLYELNTHYRIVILILTFVSQKSSATGVVADKTLNVKAVRTSSRDIMDLASD
jgi:hypothetical protein